MQSLLGAAPLPSQTILLEASSQGTPATAPSQPILSWLLLPLVMIWIIGYYNDCRLLIDGYASLSLTCA
jgi:hypothetical protein